MPKEKKPLALDLGDQGSLSEDGAEEALDGVKEINPWGLFNTKGGGPGQGSSEPSTRDLGDGLIASKTINDTTLKDGTQETAQVDLGGMATNAQYIMRAGPTRKGNSSPDYY